MLDAVRAEALKLVRHRATWLMVWIFPIGIVAITLIQIAQETFGQAIDEPLTAAGWISQSAKIWSFPLDGGGRFFIAGFAALAFAGEYGWNTWKLIIPARTRWQLIAAKWIVCSMFLLLALAAADLVGLLGSWLRGALGGIAIPDGVTIAALADMHTASAGHALVPILYTIAWAALFAILTNSLLATMILSFVMVLLEQLLLAGARFAYDVVPSLTSILLQILPFYHIASLIAWAGDTALAVPLGTGASFQASRSSSLAIVLAWIGVVASTTLVRFSRQDLN